MGVAGLERVVAMSQVYETDPVGGPDDQGAYLNMVVEIETTLDPFALLRRCQRIEGEAMRQRVVRWGPRTLDVDIIMYDDVVIETADLVRAAPAIRGAAFRAHAAGRDRSRAVSGRVGRASRTGRDHGARPARSELT